jgi:hypothetical protein
VWADDERTASPDSHTFDPVAQPGNALTPAEVDLYLVCGQERARQISAVEKANADNDDGDLATHSFVAGTGYDVISLYSWSHSFGCSIVSMGEQAFAGRG